MKASYKYDIAQAVKQYNPSRFPKDRPSIPPDFSTEHVSSGFPFSFGQAGSKSRIAGLTLLRTLSPQDRSRAWFDINQSVATWERKRGRERSEQKSSPRDDESQQGTRDQSQAKNNDDESGQKTDDREEQEEHRDEGGYLTLISVVLPERGPE